MFGDGLALGRERDSERDEEIEGRTGNQTAVTTLIIEQEKTNTAALLQIHHSYLILYRWFIERVPTYSTCIRADIP